MLRGLLTKCVYVYKHFLVFALLLCMTSTQHSLNIDVAFIYGWLLTHNY